VILIDDVLLADRLREDELVSISTPLATTCAWWWRLASAAHGGRGGALSRRLSGWDGPPTRAIDQLREDVEVLDLRALIPAMARAARAFRLNLLAAEALVAAEVLAADIVVGQDTPRLREACRVRGITYLVEA
jgi:hypothetical protein